MLAKNMGRTDRMIRAAVGVIALIAFFMLAAGVLKWVALIVAVLLLATAAMGSCPPYQILGIDTSRTKG